MESTIGFVVFLASTQTSFRCQAEQQQASHKSAGCGPVGLELRVRVTLLSGYFRGVTTDGVTNVVTRLCVLTAKGQRID